MTKLEVVAFFLGNAAENLGTFVWNHIYTCLFELLAAVAKAN